MSSFRQRMQQGRPQPPPGPTRRWLVPVAVGFVVEGAIAGLLLATGSNSVFGPLLLLVAACVLGWRYGRLRGAIAAVGPLAVLVIAELVRQSLGGTGGANAISAALIGTSAALFIGFFAWISGALRRRYRPKPMPPANSADADYTARSPWRS